MNFDDLKNIDVNQVIDTIKNYFESLEIEGIIGWLCLVLGIILIAVSIIL
ncbi:MAG: hypothetical protein ACMXX9_03470 [Candidatus Woesearchaeota archaeon]